jgi:hypothetical protein
VNDNWLKSLGNLDGLRPIVINLWDALQEGSLDVDLIAEFGRRVNEVARTVDLRTPNGRAVLYNRLLAIVFDDAQRFQCQVHLGSCEAPTLVTFRSLGNLGWLIESHAGLKEELIEAGAPASCFNSSNVSADASTEDCEVLAECIDEVGGERDDFFLGLDAAAAKRKQIVWFTHLADLEERLGGVTTRPRDPYAYRVRNWLGLGHMSIGEHLFAFISTAAAAAICGAQVARPTVFDGIDNRWFKHRRLRPYGDGWGRTLDLDRLESAELDGGWEAVMAAPRFAGQFLCVYIGRIRPAPGKSDRLADEGVLVRALLGDRAFEGVLAEMAARIEQGPQ